VGSRTVQVVTFKVIRDSFWNRGHPMAIGDQINFRPHFKKEGATLPCAGEAGDLYVFTPLDEGERDPTPQGLASLWFCTKSAESDGRNAVWARVQFDGVASCAVRPPQPPQGRPDLREG
jgi:hypothetical protein